MSSFLLLGVGTDASAGGGGANNIAYDVSPISGHSQAATSFGPNSGTTTAANTIAILDLGFNASASGLSVSSITDTSGLTWTRRGTSRNAEPHVVTNGWLTIERWYTNVATGGTLPAPTVTTSATFDAANSLLYVIKGQNVSTPWDASGQFTANAASGTPTITGISTTSANTMMLMSAFSADPSTNPTAQTAGTGFTAVTDSNNTLATDWARLSTQTGTRTSILSAASEAFGTSWTTGWIALFDALVSS